ncbi:flagellar basal-body rod protein FlgC [Hypnocyclicus thermotrophus]|uniref:Flagellar basal-body rod protein FlgC n=1 Tax=Hypnocyclicus thermotrophus TaxID=1627895 RepID=A0AA46DY08_9FUSO|nr:flagellar basal body rod protein FlgC [Hypnocyclicus thermotrophus]TDT69142.1 flagellar basal-body rod protein FlgC [Hypnocyclicus thermotrophus]
MGVFNIMNKAASGMTAERFRMDIIADNIANANTTVTEQGGPYRRKLVVFEEKLKKELKVPMNINIDSKEASISKSEGVKVAKVIEDKTPFRYVYDPNHPNANEKGYVAMPNVNTINEMVDLITAQRAYEANATVVTNAKSMATAALQIGK